MILQKKLQGEIEKTLLPLLGKPSSICIIDPPGHSNIGDSAIFLGEIDFFRRHFPQASLSFYDFESYSPSCERFIEEADVICIHGGGNFGDIWPHHHRIRTTVFDRFPHKKVVQLPQSISFSSPDGVKATAAVIAKHKDLTLVLRDHKSLAFAKANFECETRLAPDMAFAMNPLTRLPPIAPLFCLLRRDKEVASDHGDILTTIRESGLQHLVDDWLDEPSTLLLKVDRRARRYTRQQPKLLAPLRSAIFGLRERYARQRLSAGVRMLSQGELVVTDRLHAHIMSTLLGIPNLVFDSFGGKISSFYEAWTKDWHGAELMLSASDLKNALAARSSQSQVAA